MNIQYLSLHIQHTSADLENITQRPSVTRKKDEKKSYRKYWRIFLHLSDLTNCSFSEKRAKMRTKMRNQYSEKTRVTTAVWIHTSKEEKREENKKGGEEGEEKWGGNMSSEPWNSHQRKAKTGHCLYPSLALGEAFLHMFFIYILRTTVWKGRPMKDMNTIHGASILFSVVLECYVQIQLVHLYVLKKNHHSFPDAVPFILHHSVTAWLFEYQQAITFLLYNTTAVIFSITNLPSLPIPCSIYFFPSHRPPLPAINDYFSHHLSLPPPPSSSLIPPPSA